MHEMPGSIPALANTDLFCLNFFSFFLSFEVQKNDPKKSMAEVGVEPAISGIAVQCSNH